jgi:membrane-associated protein
VPEAAAVVDALLEAVARLEPAALYLVAGVFMVLETSLGIGLVVPGDAVVLLAGSTVNGPWRFGALVAVAVLGSLAGESIGYLLGRRYGDSLRGSRIGRLVGPARWAAAESFLHGRGGRALAAARFMAVVHAVAPVVAGAAAMPFRRFLAWCSLGSLAWAVTYVGVGTAVGASWRAYGHRLGVAGYALLAAVVAVVLLVRWRRRRTAMAPPSAEPPAGDPPEPDRTPVA